MPRQDHANPVSATPALRMRADLALALCTLLWGYTFVVVKNPLDHISVLLFLAVRFTVAAALMAAIRVQSLRRLGEQEV
jgi:drug/metabolite transporter (DMT)-like permease